MSHASSVSTTTLSLVSHTNVGKTTLLRTLIRRDVGEVADRAHVTSSADDYALIETPEGDLLRLSDTPGFGDSVRLLKRLRMSTNPIGWFMTQVWDRFTDRAFFMSQIAIAACATRATRSFTRQCRRGSGIGAGRLRPSSNPRLGRQPRSAAAQPHGRTAASRHRARTKMRGAGKSPAHAGVKAARMAFDAFRAMLGAGRQAPRNRRRHAALGKQRRSCGYPRATWRARNMRVSPIRCTRLPCRSRDGNRSRGPVRATVFRKGARWLSSLISDERKTGARSRAGREFNCAAARPRRARVDRSAHCPARAVGPF